MHLQLLALYPCRYPNTACELLTCDVPQVNDRLGGDETLLNLLYDFLDREPPLNPLLASFFSKTIGNLIARKTEQVKLPQPVVGDGRHGWCDHVGGRWGAAFLAVPHRWAAGVRAGSPEGCLLAGSGSPRELGQLVLSPTSHRHEVQGRA